MVFLVDRVDRVEELEVVVGEERWEGKESGRLLECVGKARVVGE